MKHSIYGWDKDEPHPASGSIFRSKKNISKKTIAVIAALAVVTSLFGPLLSLTATVTNKHLLVNTSQAATPFSLKTLRGVDVMKYTKDTMTNQPSDSVIEGLINAAASTGANYISLSIPMDASADYPAGGKPAPRDAYSLTQKWADTIHAKGLKIIWRGTWSGIEGIYGFPKRTGSNRLPAGTAASAPTDGSSTWLGKTYQYVVNNPAFFADGDIWAPLPERTEGIFQDSTSFLPYSGAGIQTNFANFFNDLKKTSDQAFAKIGKQAYTGMTANNYSEVVSTWLPQSVFDTAGVVSIDYYGINHSAQEMESDLRKMAAAKGKPVFLQEWGDYWNVAMSQADRTRYLNEIYAVLQKLSDEGVLMGFNYWGGWDNNAEGIFTRSGSDFGLNYRGKLLKNLYAANTGSTATLPPTPSSGGSQPNYLCGSPGDGRFTACYYKDTNLSNPVLYRSDQEINFDWGHGSPEPSVPTDNFSARWEGNFQFNAGTYTFTATADDGVRVYLNNQLIIDQWKNQPATGYSTARQLTAGTHTVKMEYYEQAGGAIAKLSWKQDNITAPPATPIPVQSGGTNANCPAPSSNAFTGCYYNDRSLSSLALARTDSAVNFDWGHLSPDPKIPNDNFSARWEGNFQFNGGEYEFAVTADDGVRLYIDNEMVINQWKDQPASTYTVKRALPAGNHLVKIEYYENGGGAIAKANWKQLSSITPPPSTPATGSCGGQAVNMFTGCYYKGKGFSDLLMSRIEASINFTWNHNSPDPKVPADGFSVRWEGSHQFESGNHTFTATADDGIRVYVDGQMIIDQWKDQPASTYTAGRYMTAGSHTIKVEYYEQAGGAITKVSWRKN